MGQQIQTAGFYLSGFLCVVLAVLKLTFELHWSWWRVLLPLWVVLGHNALYITVGFVWLFFADDGAAGEEVTIRQEDCPYGYELAAMLCLLVLADNLLRRIEGPGETTWFWLRSGRWGLMCLVHSVWCASFCSGLGLYVRAIAESAESSGPPQSRIPLMSNTVLGLLDSTSFLTVRGLGRTAMSRQELHRVEVLARVKNRNLKLKDAAALLRLSHRQVKRLWKYRRGGAKALQHGNAGRPSNRAKPEQLRRAVLARVRQKYSGAVGERFGPTLAAEHLAKEDGLEIDAETLRRWMLADGLWSRERKRKPSSEPRVYVFAGRLRVEGGERRFP